MASEKSTHRQRGLILSKLKDLSDPDFLAVCKKHSGSHSLAFDSDTIIGTRNQILAHLTKNNASTLISKLLEPCTLDEYPKTRTEGEGHTPPDGIYLVNRAISLYPSKTHSEKCTLTVDLFRYGVQSFTITKKQAYGFTRDDNYSHKEDRGHHKLFIGIKNGYYAYSGMHSDNYSTIEFLEKIMGPDHLIPWDVTDAQFLKEGLTTADTIIQELIDDQY